jgi:hypothetical protein
VYGTKCLDNGFDEIVTRANQENAETTNSRIGKDNIVFNCLKYHKADVKTNRIESLQNGQRLQFRDCKRVEEIYELTDSNDGQKVIWAIIDDEEGVNEILIAAPPVPQRYFVKVLFPSFFGGYQLHQEIGDNQKSQDEEHELLDSQGDL